MTAQHVTPSELPEGRICKSINVPNSREWLGIFDKILLSATEEWNWQQSPDGTVTVEETVAFWQSVLADYWDEAACATGGDIPAPFWDDPDGADAGEALPASEQEWYEELAHWIITGFLAITFTPSAAIFYYTTIRPARIAFRARDYGAVAEILIDGVLQGEVDTFSGVDQVIYYDFDVPLSEALTALDVVPAKIEIRHSGTANPDATPTVDGYALEVVRDYFGRDSTNAPLTRVNDDGEIETSIDGGITWVENPDADPRNQVIFPPLTGSDVSCRAANSIVKAIEDTFDELLTGMANGGSAFGGAWLLVGLLAGKFGGTIGAAFFGAPVVAIAVFLITAIIDATIAIVSAALDEEVYDKLRCIFIVLVDGEGRMPEENMPRLYAAIYQELDTLPAQILDLFFDFVGFGGLSNFAALDLDPLLGCACCPPSLINYSEPFTDGGRWQTFIGKFGANADVRGVYDPTVGRTALGSVKSTVLGVDKWCYATVDLGMECNVRNVQFYSRSSTSPGGTPVRWRIAWYDENFVLLGENTALSSTSTSWALRSNVMDVDGIRYVAVGMSASAPAFDLWIDDLNFLYGVP